MADPINSLGGISKPPRRFRYLIDIVVLLAITFLLDVVVEAFVRVPINLQTGFVFDALGKMSLVAAGCGLVLLRGEKLADIGLKRPKGSSPAFLLGIAYAGVVLTRSCFAHTAGLPPDLNRLPGLP